MYLKLLFESRRRFALLLYQSKLITSSTEYADIIHCVSLTSSALVPD